MSTVTCRTEGCANSNIALEVDLTIYTDDGSGDTVQADGVVCGVCGVPITDIV